MTVVAGALFVSSASAAASQPTPTTPERANALAYQQAMKCFVANGNERGNRRDAGDAAGAARYDALARRAFDAAVQLGKTLGYANARVNSDFAAATKRELPLIVNSNVYAREVAATCRAYGLM